MTPSVSRNDIPQASLDRLRDAEGRVDVSVVEAFHKAGYTYVSIAEDFLDISYSGLRKHLRNARDSGGVKPATDVVIPKITERKDPISPEQVKIIQSIPNLSEDPVKLKEALLLVRKLYNDNYSLREMSDATQTGNGKGYSLSGIRNLIKRSHAYAPDAKDRASEVSFEVKNPRGKVEPDPKTVKEIVKLREKVASGDEKAGDRYAELLHKELSRDVAPGVLAVAVGLKPRSATIRRVLGSHGYDYPVKVKRNS